MSRYRCYECGLEKPSHRDRGRVQCLCGNFMTFESTETREMRYSIGVAPEGDSVVQWGNISDGSHKTKYFGIYEDALEFLREQFGKFTKGE